MRSTVLGLLLGMAWLQMQAQLPALNMLAGLLALALPLLLLGWLLARYTRRGSGPALRLLRMLLCISAGVSFGIAWAGLLAQYRIDDELPLAWEGRDVTVIGTVDGLPAALEHGVRFNFRVESVVPQGSGLPVVPARLALSWYDGSAARARAERAAAAAGEPEADATPSVAPAPAVPASAGLNPASNTAAGSAVSPVRLLQPMAVPSLQPGQRWQLNVRLRRPHGSANPDGFDYELWLLEQGIRATGSVRPDQPPALKNQLLQDFVWRPGNLIAYARGWLRQRILAALPQQPYAAVIVALVVGDQRAIERQDWTIFNRTGVGHLVAISGLHITLVAGLCAALASFLWRRSGFTGGQWPLLLPAPRVAVLAGLLAALLYTLLAGSGVPAQRTLYMLAVVGAAYWAGRLTPLSHVLTLALAVVLLIDPWAMLWPGFWLSFGTVALLLYASVGRTGARPRQEQDVSRWRRQWLQLGHSVRAGAYAQYVVMLGLLPLTVLLFGQYSLASPLANALAIPLVTLLVVPLALLGAVLPAPLAQWLLQAAHQLLAWLAVWLNWLSSQPWAVWHAPLPEPWMFALAMGGTLLVLAPRGWPGRWLGCFGWLPLLLNTPQAPAPGQLQMTALDVGQGMAVLVETANHRLLYDTGPAYGTDSDAGNRVIVPYLRARGIDHLDVVVVSHGDSDHAGGLASLLADIRVDRVYSSLPLTSPVLSRVPDHQRCLAAQQWRWDGAALHMLYPVQALYDSNKWNANARSCVLKVTMGTHALLLPGDIQATQEDELVNSPARTDLVADVLLAPHHGSGTSSSLPFLQAVQPELAIFQMGYRNRFNHPKPEVQARYEALGIRTVRSDQAGAVSIRFERQGVHTEVYRQSHARYWYGR